MYLMGRHVAVFASLFKQYGKDEKSNNVNNYHSSVDILRQKKESGIKSNFNPKKRNHAKRTKTKN